MVLYLNLKLSFPGNFNTVRKFSKFCPSDNFLKDSVSMALRNLRMRTLDTRQQPSPEAFAC